MYPTILEVEARQERYKDMQRLSNRMQLIREAGLQSPGLWGTLGQFARWIGAMRPVWRGSRSSSRPAAAVYSGQRCC
jgi:hypothetical protein